MADLIIIWGPPCSGKTTEALSVGGDVIDFDLIAQEIGSPKAHDHPDRVLSEATAIRRSRIERALRIGSGVITQTFLSREEEESFLQAGAEVRLIDPGIDSCIRRAARDERPQWTFGIIRQWYSTEGRSRKPVKGERDMKLQHKFAPLEAEVDQRGYVSGYASRFGMKDQGGDVVIKGAFGDLSRKPKMLYQHDPSKVVGVWDVYEERSDGLYVEGRLNLGSTLGKDVHSNLEFGAIDGMSIGYKTVQATKAAGARELRKVDLWEVSFVTFPMLPEAVVQSVKSIEADNPAILKRFVEEIMREADFSADEAKAAAAAVARVRAEREVSDEHKAADFAAALKDAIRGLN